MSETATAREDEAVAVEATSEAVGGVEPFFEDDFEGFAVGQEPSGGSNGFSWGGSHDGTYVSDSESFTGTRSLRCEYGPTNPNTGNPDHWWAEQRFNLGQNLTELWIEYYLRLPENYHHRNHPTQANNNKFFVLWADSYSTSDNFQCAIEVNRVSYTQSSARLMTRDVDGRLSTSDGFSASDLLNLTWGGEWKRVRIHLRMASGPTAEDGVFEGWMDDDLAWRSDPEFIIHTIGANNYIRNGYLMGYDNSHYDEAVAFYIDNFKIWDEDPEWAGST
ncbi:MAG TPA: hypothetical protein VK966_08060 [Longimicrobiales bacterium]|nr:hypothetical protein [Longimicrobiales bacterium]